MLTVSDVVFSFSSRHSPAASAEPGEAVRFVTKDCFGGLVDYDEEPMTTLDSDQVNPATGPVFLLGAEPGDVLVAEILSVDVEDRGLVCTAPGSGPLSDGSRQCRRVVGIRRGRGEFNGLSFPVRPMVGVIGVAPGEGEVFCGYPGPHGGNLDCRLMAAGARAFFPVRVPGGLFQLGDLHAAMGDGELGGSGIETGGEVMARLGLVKRFSLAWPVLEAGGRVYTLASGREFGGVQRECARQMQRLISGAWGWEGEDAALYLAIRGDVEVCQSCTPGEFDMVLRVGIPMEAGMAPLVPFRWDA